MTRLMMLLFFLCSGAFAGVGGISGGHIHFQEDSTWVNVLYSKSLCQNGEKYRAVVPKCTKWEKDDDDRKCVKKKKKAIFQPMESMRKRCKRREDDRCVEWVKVDYYQDPDRVVKLFDDDGGLKQIKHVSVPKCN